MNDPMDPITQFRKWFEEVSATGTPHPEAFTLATATPDAIPSARVLLLKSVSDDGIFQFFTNFGSRKAAELDRNPRASMVFYWAVREWQVRVEGRITRLPNAESDAYWKTRPRDSQIGAYASRQSEVLPDRAALESRLAEARTKFPGATEVPRPEFWGGYGLVPECIEFWIGRESRLHDRTRFTRLPKGGWKAETLSP